MSDSARNKAMKDQFKRDKERVIKNTVYLVIDNPHEGNYGYFQGLFPTMEKAIKHICGDSLEYVQEILDLDETQPTQNDISNFFELSNPSIIPVFGLDKSKPMYVEINGNQFYMGVVTHEKVAGHYYRKYNFSK